MYRNGRLARSVHLVATRHTTRFGRTANSHRKCTNATKPVQLSDSNVSCIYYNSFSEDLIECWHLINSISENILHHLTHQFVTEGIVCSEFNVVPHIRKVKGYKRSRAIDMVHRVRKFVTYPHKIRDLPFPGHRTPVSVCCTLRKPSFWTHNVNVGFNYLQTKEISNFGPGVSIPSRSPKTR